MYKVIRSHHPARYVLINKENEHICGYFKIGWDGDWEFHLCKNINSETDINMFEYIKGVVNNLNNGITY